MKGFQFSKPHLLVVVGVPGAGKTTFAESFAEAFKTPIISRRQLHELTGGEDADHIATYILNMMIAAEQTVVIDRGGETIAERKDLVAFARKNNYEPLFVWVQTDLDTAEYRATQGKDATMNLNEFNRLKKAFEIPTAKEPVVVISGKHTFATQARTILRRIAADRRQATLKPAPGTHHAGSIVAPPPRIVPRERTTR